MFDTRSMNIYYNFLNIAFVKTNNFTVTGDSNESSNTKYIRIQMYLFNFRFNLVIRGWDMIFGNLRATPDYFQAFFSKVV